MTFINIGLLCILTFHVVYVILFICYEMNRELVLAFKMYFINVKLMSILNV